MGCCFEYRIVAAHFVFQKLIRDRS